MTAACIKIEEVADGKQWIYFALPNGKFTDATINDYFEF